MINSTNDIFQALRQVVHGDPAQQAYLFGLDDANGFITAVQQLALSLDYTLTEEDVRQAMRSGRKSWSERNLP